MENAANYIALAIPFFFLFIGIEYWFSKVRHLDLYRFNDAITNLNCGIGQQIIGVFLKTATILLYVYCYDHYRFTTIPDTVWTWILLFVGVDFFYYWFHRLAHEISVLWGSHVVHHQSEEYNLTVALRQAWIQGIFSSSFYLPLAFMGFHPVAFVTINSFQTLYQFWIHTKTIHKLPAWFEYVFNTPSHHRVHHGVNPIYIDRNHGGTLIVFDRLFGTFQEEQEEVVYGITQQPNSWNPLWLNVEYWINMAKDMSKATNWKDKWGIFWHTPGWKPAELTTVASAKSFNAKSFHKYDTHIAHSLNYYILVQHIVTLFGTTLFLFKGDFLSYMWRYLVALMLLHLLINVGGLLENKTWAFRSEWIRLLLLVVIAIYLYNINTISLWLCLGVGVYAIIAVVYLRPLQNEPPSQTAV